MRKFLMTWAVVSLTAIGALAQVRGTGRLMGNVYDKNSGKPIAGATVTITLPGGRTQPIVTKTDSRGHWAAIGMTDGQWNIDISAAGYATSRGTAAISELSQTPAIRTQLDPEARQEPAASVPVAPSIAPDVVATIKEGESLLKVKEGDSVTDAQGTPHTVTADEVKQKAAQAAADFEKALPQIGTDKPELVDVRNQVLQVMAQAYYKAGDLKNAIATFEKLDAVDPMPATPDAAHTTREVLLANLYLENGQLDQGKTLLDKLPASAITDATAYVNIGILFLNKKNPADATTYFTKAIELDPKRAESYYYRGLAEIQLKKNAQAKADLQQVLALSPDSPEAHDAKQLLAGLK